MQTFTYSNYRVELEYIKIHITQSVVSLSTIDLDRTADSYNPSDVYLGTLIGLVVVVKIQLRFMVTSNVIKKTLMN